MAASCRAAAVSAAVLWLLGACSFDAAYDGVGLRCDADHGCPDGTACTTGTCQLVRDAGDTADSGLPDTIIERSCPGTLTDQDDFQFLSDLRWYSFVDGDGELWVEDGVVRVQLFEASTRAGLISAGSYSLPRTAFAFRFPPPSPEIGTYAALELISEDELTAFLAIFRRNDVIVAEKTSVGMTGEIVEERIYKPDEHQVWRIRREDGTVTWETSPDAIVWTPLATAVPDPGLPSTIRLRIVIETLDTSESYDQVFDDMVVCALE